jgi:hypothetical protein
MDVKTLTVNVEMRVVSCLRRRGFLNDDSSDPSAEPSARSALEACLEGSLGLATRAGLSEVAHGPASDRPCHSMVELLLMLGHARISDEEAR